MKSFKDKNTILPVITYTLVLLLLEMYQNHFRHLSAWNCGWQLIPFGNLANYIKLVSQGAMDSQYALHNYVIAALLMMPVGLWLGFFRKVMNWKEAL